MKKWLLILNLLGLITVSGVVSAQQVQQCQQSEDDFNGKKLVDLAKVTHLCAAAALNAAAKKVQADVKSDGTYFFTTFCPGDAGANRTYFVGFTSNVEVEPAIEVEVSLYCQQGFDPAQTIKEVKILSTNAQKHCQKK